MKCPKCGLEQPEREDCTRCGLLVRNWNNPSPVPAPARASARPEDGAKDTEEAGLDAYGLMAAQGFVVVLHAASVPLLFMPMAPSVLCFLLLVRRWQHGVGVLMAAGSAILVGIAWFVGVSKLLPDDGREALSTVLSPPLWLATVVTAHQLRRRGVSNRAIHGLATLTMVLSLLAAVGALAWLALVLLLRNSPGRWMAP